MNILIYGATFAHRARVRTHLGTARPPHPAAGARPGTARRRGCRTLRVLSTNPEAISADVLDLADEAAIRPRIAEADREAGGFDVALIAHGSLPAQAGAQSDAGQLRQAIEVNAVSVAQLCEAIAPLFERAAAARSP